MHKLRIDPSCTAVAKLSGVLSPAGLASLQAQLSGRNTNIGVKKLLGLLDMVKQTDESERVDKLVAKLEDDMISY